MHMLLTSGETGLLSPSLFPMYWSQHGTSMQRKSVLVATLRMRIICLSPREISLVYTNYRPRVGEQGMIEGGCQLTSVSSSNATMIRDGIVVIHDELGPIKTLYIV